MATKPHVISASTSLILPVRDNKIRAIALCSGSDAATFELFDGTIGTIATANIVSGGTLYAVGDRITVSVAGGGVAAVFEVESVDAVETGVITGLTLVSGGTGYTVGATYATTTDSENGSGATISPATVTDGTSLGKIAVSAGSESTDVEMHALSINGISARITGSNAKGYIYEC